MAYFVSGMVCDAEILDMSAMAHLAEGKKAWRGCLRPASVTKRGPATGQPMHYCSDHAEAKEHGGRCHPFP